jgi:hypothetical protein
MIQLHAFITEAQHIEMVKLSDERGESLSQMINHALVKTYGIPPKEDKSINEGVYLSVVVFDYRSHPSKRTSIGVGIKSKVVEVAGVPYPSLVGEKLEDMVRSVVYKLRTKKG